MDDIPMVCQHWGCGQDYESGNNRIECTFHPGRYEFGSAHVSFDGLSTDDICRVYGLRAGLAVEVDGTLLVAHLDNIGES